MRRLGLLLLTMSAIGCAEDVVIYVAPSTVRCYIPFPRPCLQISDQAGGPWSRRGSIEGFSHEPGFLYRIRVRKEEAPRPVPADAPSERWRLLETLTKSPVKFEPPKELFGRNWFHSSSIETQLTFVANGTLNGRAGCQAFHAAVQLTWNEKITIGKIVREKRACRRGEPNEQSGENRMLAILATVEGVRLRGSELEFDTGSGDGAREITFRAH